MLLIFNDIAGSEVLLILVFILIFFGSKSIPGLAKTLGRTMRQVKEASNEIQNEIKKSGAGMREDLNLKGIIEDTAEDIRRPLDQYAADLDDAVSYRPQRKTPFDKAKEQSELGKTDQSPVTPNSDTPQKEAPKADQSAAPSSPDQPSSEQA